MLFQCRGGLAATLLLTSLIAVTQAQSPQLTETASARLRSLAPLATDSHPITTPTEVPPRNNESGNNETEKRASVNTSPSVLNFQMYTWTKLLPMPPVKKLSLIEKAYLDVYAILSEDNQCSHFYGGPMALEALNEFARQLKSGYFDRSVGVRMSGNVSYTSNYTTGLSYRIFEVAELNLNGPFFRANTTSSDVTIARIGEFSPNTREARMAIILHELGHLIRVAPKQWVLPNDGNDPGTSKQNTLKVIEICRDQIKSRAHVSFEETMGKLHVDGQQSPSLTAPSESIAAGASGKSETVRQNGSQLDARCEVCRREIQIPQDR